MKLGRTTQWWHLLQNLFLIHFKHQKSQVIKILYFLISFMDLIILKFIEIYPLFNYFFYINDKHPNQVALVRTWLTAMDKEIVRVILLMFFVAKRSAMSINLRPAQTPKKVGEVVPERNFPHELVTLQLVKIHL